MKQLLFLILTMMICSCTHTAQKTVDWRCGWEVAPGAIVDTAAVKAHVALHPERWEAAFEFLKQTDLDTLPVGEYEIAGRDVYAIVSEYVPKPEAECLFEAHRVYIDLQYLIRGRERMGVTTPDKVTEQQAYDTARDIAFYAPDAEARYEAATPEAFYVFLPADIHRPSMRYSDEPVGVKKIVIKIRN